MQNKFYKKKTGRIKSYVNKTFLVLLISFPAFMPSWGQIPESLNAAEDTIYVFRFVPGKDMFYVPWKGNEVTLDSLLSVVRRNRPAIENGQRYISVSSYAATKASNPRRLGYLRNQRVKSELISRAHIREEHFVTDKLIAEPFAGESNVVVVSFPAPVAKVAEIAGPEAAERVKKYNEKLYADSPQGKHAAELARQEKYAAQQEEARRKSEAAARAEKEKAAREAEQKASGKAGTEEPQTRTEQLKNNRDYAWALRADLLRWATLTPDLGLEWRVTPNWGILVNGSYTSWSWKDARRRYALWNISPEIRWYTGKQFRGYIGAMYHAGSFNYKLGKTGRQGDYMGGGLTGGYQLQLNRFLSLDFHIGAGYTYADYDKYESIEGVYVRQGSKKKNYWGINQAGIKLVWKFSNTK